MFAMFGIGPMEMLIVGGLACAGAVAAGIVIWRSIAGSSQPNSSQNDANEYAENSPPRDHN